MTFLFNWQLTLPLLAQDLWICCINIQHSSFVMWPQALLSKLKLQFLISEELSWNFCFEMQMCAACLAPGLPPTRLLNTKPYRIRFVNQRDFSESHESFRPVRPRPHRNRQKKARICCKICEMPRMCLHVCFVCEDLHREAKTPCDAGQAKGSSVLFFTLSCVEPKAHVDAVLTWDELKRLQKRRVSCEPLQPKQETSRTRRGSPVRTSENTSDDEGSLLFLNPTTFTFPNESASVKAFTL